MPAFLERARGMTRPEATITFGVIALVTGFVGMLAGGWMGDRLLRRTPHAYLWVSGIATLAAAPFTWDGLTSTDRTVYLTAIFIGEILIFISTGPINSALLNVVSPVERATAVGLAVFVMHFLGDIPSPPLIGMISDTSSLASALLIVPVSILVSGVIWTYAAWEAG